MALTVQLLINFLLSLTMKFFIIACIILFAGIIREVILFFKRKSATSHSEQEYNSVNLRLLITHVILNLLCIAILFELLVK